MEKYLHIICHDVPYPLDYGGVFDLFCKLKALKNAGVRIYLHCFDYGRGRQPELNKYCEEVHYYCRNEGHKGFSIKMPYIACSRSNQQLVENLLKDDYPILLEGIHCTYVANCEKFQQRKLILRLHNVEYEYYYRLYKHCSSLFRKVYYYNESRLLKHYEQKMADQLTIAAVAEKDVITYQQEFHARHISHVPVFIPWEEVKSREGMGTYCLYHGNLSVEENEKAVIWLLEHVFSDLKLPFVIAGKNPSPRLEKMAHAQNHTCLVANPAEDEMNDLIAKAQMNILPSFNETGIKLKLINALFNGRHCVVNEAAIEHTGLEGVCQVASNASSFKEVIERIYHLPFSREQKMLREKTLRNIFNNADNANKLISLIW